MVYRRLAQLEGIAVSTARDQFVGYLTPFQRLARRIAHMTVACQDHGRHDLLVEQCMELLKVAMGRPALDWVAAKHLYDYANAREGLSQADFDHLLRTGQVTRVQWIAYRKTVTREVAAALRFIAAGDLEYA